MNEEIAKWKDAFEAAKLAGLRLPIGLDLSDRGGPALVSNCTDGEKRTALSWNLALYMIRSVAWGWLGCPDILRSDDGALVLLEPHADLSPNSVSGKTLDDALRNAVAERVALEAAL